MSQSSSDERAMVPPWIEIKRQIGSGYFRSYVMVYRKPLRVWIYGRWVIGRHLLSRDSGVKGPRDDTAV